MDSKTKRAIILLQKLRAELRGVGTSVVRRACGLNEAGISVELRTIDYVLDFRAIVNLVRNSMSIPSEIKITNVHDFLISEERDEFRLENPSFLASVSLLASESPFEVVYGGVVRRRDWKLQGTPHMYMEYYRPDGSLYLRAIGMEPSLTRGASLIEWVRRDGVIQGQFLGVRDLWKTWLHSDLEQDEELFVMLDGASLSSTGFELLTNLGDEHDHNIKIAHGASLHYSPDGRAIPVSGYAESQWLSSNLDVLVFLTEEQRAEFVSAFEPAYETAVIGHETGRELVEIPAPLGDQLTLVTVTSLFPLKRVDHLLRAFKIFHESNPDVVLEIVGDGPERSGLELLAQELDLPSNAVKFNGYMSDPSVVIRRAAASIITSTRETFSMPIVESMAMGVPVIAYSVDYGPKSLVNDGVNGILVEDGDIEALAHAMAAVVRPESAHLRAGALATATEFTPDSINGKWIDLINRLSKSANPMGV